MPLFKNKTNVSPLYYSSVNHLDVHVSVLTHSFHVALNRRIRLRHRFCLSFSLQPLHAQNLDSVLCVLDDCITRRADYEAAFIRRVDSLRHDITLNTDKAEAYRLWTEVGREEFRHSSRKALEAYRQAQLLAEQMGREELATRSKLKIALIYGQMDLPWEGEQLLASIGDITRYSESTRRMFYDVYNDVHDFYRQGNIPNEISEVHLQKASLLTDSIKKISAHPLPAGHHFPVWQSRCTRHGFDLEKRIITVR